MLLLTDATVPRGNPPSAEVSPCMDIKRPPSEPSSPPVEYPPESYDDAMMPMLSPLPDVARLISMPLRSPIVRPLPCMRRPCHCVFVAAPPGQKFTPPA